MHWKLCCVNLVNAVQNQWNYNPTGEMLRSTTTIFHWLCKLLCSLKENCMIILTIHSLTKSPMLKYIFDLALECMSMHAFTPHTLLQFWQAFKLQAASSDMWINISHIRSLICTHPTLPPKSGFFNPSLFPAKKMWVLKRNKVEFQEHRIRNWEFHPTQTTMINVWNYPRKARTNPRNSRGLHFGIQGSWCSISNLFWLY